MRKTVVIPASLAIAAALSLLVPTLAAGQVAVPTPAAAAPAGWLSIGEVALRLSDAGWTVAEIEAEPNDGNFKACLISADGRQIEARIDPLSGTITRQEAENCFGDDDNRGPGGGHDRRSDD
jgi:hypothetical protein